MLQTFLLMAFALLAIATAGCNEISRVRQDPQPAPTIVFPASQQGEVGMDAFYKVLTDLVYGSDFLEIALGAKA